MILFDLKHLTDGAGGIQSDTRELMLMALQHLPTRIGGLVFPRHNLGRPSRRSQRLDYQSLRLHSAREGSRSARLLNVVGRRFLGKADFGDALVQRANGLTVQLGPRTLAVSDVDPAFNRGIFEWLMRDDLALAHAAPFDRVEYRLLDRSWSSINRASTLAVGPRQGFELAVGPEEKLFLQAPLWLRPRGNQRHYVRWHDAINLLSIGWERAYDAHVFAAAMRLQIESGARFICNSETSRSDLVRFFPEAADRSTVLYCPVRGLEHESDGHAARAILERHGLVGRYLATVSSASPRKNFEGILEIFERISYRHPDVKLVVIGKPFRLSADLRRALRRLKAAGKLVLLDSISRVTLATALRHAQAYLSGSVHEGFGKGLIEAQSLGVPVVAPKTPVFHELIGDTGGLYNGFDYSEAVSLLDGILASDARRQDLSTASVQNARRFEPTALLPQFLAALDIQP